MSKKFNTGIESITQLESAENKLKIVVYREEADKDFDHNLNVKVIGQIINAKHETLYAMAEALLNLHRVNRVEVRNTLGHGICIHKDNIE